MVKSALVGQPPATQADRDVLIGFARVAGIPDEMIHPDMGLKLPIKHEGDPLASHSDSIILSMSFAIVLVLLITGGRLGLRCFRRDLRLGLDDLFIVIAATGVCSWYGMTIGMAVLGGAGKHLYSITYQELWWFFRLAGISQLVFWPTVGLINVSIALFNRRLTGLSSRVWQYAHCTFLALLTVFILVSLFINLFSCRPATVQLSLITFGANPTLPTCFNPDTVGIALSAVHIAFQFSLLAVPLLILYIIKMSLGKKIRLAILFSTGAVACIGAVNRQVLQKKGNPDITWQFRHQLAWSTVDLFFTITAASLPVLNAALPQRLRSPSNSSPRLGNLSILQRTYRGSVRLGSQEIRSRPDGTVLDEVIEEPDPVQRIEHGLVEKDSFTRRTEKRWEEAYDNIRLSKSGGV